MSNTPLHWRKVKASRWETREQVNGTPDFVIVRQPGDSYRLKMRSSRVATLHASLSDAKAYAEDVVTSRPVG